MDMQRIPAKEGKYNLADYEKMKKTFSWEAASRFFSWNETGKVNIAYEAIDRHAIDPMKRNKAALIYSDQERKVKMTFHEMRRESNKFANVLKKYHIQKGDRVFLFLPRSPEFYIAFFGILKTGAIAGPLLDVFREQAIYDRLKDSKAKMLITTPDLLQRVPVKALPHLEEVVVLGDTSPSSGLIHFEEEMEKAGADFPIEWVDLEDVSLIHYTSGATGKPKGVLHVHHAMLQQYVTSKWVLDLQDDDVFWCTVHPGWVTGTSYGIFAPWLKGVTNVVYGGDFTPQAWYAVLEKYRVSVWYTVPTALRNLISAGDEVVRDYDFPALRHILSVGEPLNPEVITWGMNLLNIRIHDTWSMTETGAQLIANFPSEEIRPGSMGKPIPGIEAAILDHEGNELPPNHLGNLAIKKGWPSMMRGIWEDEGLYESYFRNGWYLSGDKAYRDEDGYFWFQGRLDDVINTSGERIGPFEVESKLIEHPAVREGAVVGKPDPVHGEIIKAFITLHDDVEETPELLAEIRAFVKEELGSHAAPHELEVTEDIPKTRSGKIMRRLLKSWETDRPL